MCERVRRAGAGASSQQNRWAKGDPWNPPRCAEQVAGTAFNKAGQMTSLTAYGGAETRTYDANTLQLTRIQADLLDLSYVYPAAGSNNGRISAETNNLTSTQVSYTYDQVNRLATAVSTTGGNTNWGLSFSYDVYGNRTGQTVTAGSAPAFSASFGSNNRMVGYSYDNNGNQLTTPDGATLEYDPDNRMTKWTKQGQADQYQYHPSGWRMSKSSEKYLYGPGGQLLESYRAWNDITDYVYFGGRLLYTLSAGPAVTRIYSDRLGSTRATETIEQYGGGWTTRNYYPFGEEMTTSSNNEYKFASTYRDSATGLDYAMMWYYASGTGRFLSTDPYRASGGPADPQSWNRYAYVQNDPANFIDPKGMYLCVPGVTCALEMAGSGAGNDGMVVVGGVDNPNKPEPESGVGIGGPEQMVGSGVDRAVEKFKGKGCRDLFHGIDPAALLKTQQSSGLIHMSSFSGNAANSAAMTGPSGTSPATMTIQLNTNASINGTGPDQYGFFGGGEFGMRDSKGRYHGLTGDDKRAFFLIHELGHLVNTLFQNASLVSG